MVSREAGAEGSAMRDKGEKGDEGARASPRPEPRAAASLRFSHLRICAREQGDGQRRRHRRVAPHHRPRCGHKKGFLGHNALRETESMCTKTELE